MRRWYWLPGIAAVLLSALLLWSPWHAQAQPKSGTRWIWFNEGNPVSGAPGETRYFRKSFTLDKPVVDAELAITADNSFVVWVNGTKVGDGDQWSQVYRFDVAKHLREGKNTLAVEATNEGGAAGLMATLKYNLKGLADQQLHSDATWKAAQFLTKGWEKPDFDDAKWTAALDLGPLGMAPWGKQGSGGAAKAEGQFVVPDGFRVEQMVVKPTDRGPFSIVNMTFDNRGRLLLSQEGGPTLLCVDPDDKGVYRKVVDYCKQIKNAHGMCWVKDALYLVGDGPQGTGLYRCEENKAGDAIEKVSILHKFKGGMGEHGPHAIVHGPDNMLYLVIGNHAWAQPEKLADNSPLTRWPKGLEGADQGKPGSTEDLPLPYLEDASGHAVGRRAPGGTIWRCDLNGNNFSLFSSCFRNQFDAAFSPTGELFTFDSDMEWDEALPWYRPVRICHCPPGSDFGWRSGAANHPPYYFDSLPATVDTGRGSPVGVEFYDHVQFPEKYRGAFFAADWAIGTIYALVLEKKGGSYKGKLEKFCTRSPMPVTDCAVGPDGALWFTTGGRGTQGGVHRVVYDKGVKKDYPPDVQPLSAWGRAKFDADAAVKALQDEKKPAGEAARLLTLAGQVKTEMPLAQLAKFADAKNADVRAAAVYLLGQRKADKELKELLLKAAADEDAFVRRRACEAIVRAGVKVGARDISHLLNDEDLFVRTAARLVLQRIDAKTWTEALFASDKPRIVREGIVALCKTNQADAHADAIFAHLHQGHPEEGQELLDYLRTIELALSHVTKLPGGTVRGLALDLVEMFPHKDARVNRELATLLTFFRRAKVLDDPIQPKLLAALKDARDDHAQQIHYFYCLRLLHDGWTDAQKDEILNWYENTKDWKGGHSYKGFLVNILRDLQPAFTQEDRAQLLASWDKKRLSALVLLRHAPTAAIPELKDLEKALLALQGSPKKDAQVKELKEVLVLSMARLTTPEAQAAIDKLAATDPDLREVVIRLATANPAEKDWKLLLEGLALNNKQLAYECLNALRKLKVKPKPEEAAPFRAVLLASTKLDAGNRWRAVEVLRHWTNNKQFGAEDKDWKTELSAWSKWFVQTFPKEPALPNVASDTVAESKYKYAELLAFLEKDGKKGDVVKGRAAFEKGQCLKCHKYGTEGEGIGPDLTTLAKRFKRSDTLDALYYPSKVISDQYRSTLINLKSGQQITGLAAPMGDTITVLQHDGSKVVIKKSDIDTQFASLVSVMPEKLLDQLTLQEIADLFAFMESEPKK